MELGVSLLLSVLEYMAIYYLTFRLFSFQFKPYLRHTVITSILLTLVSVLIRYFASGVVDVFVQVVLFTIVLRTVFRVHWFYSVTMSFGYILYTIVQILFLSALNLLGLLDRILSAVSTGAFIIQGATIVSAVVISELLRIFDLRFTFVPTNVYEKVSLSGRNMLIVLLAALEIMVMTCVMYWYQTDFGNAFLGITLALFAFAVLTLIILFRKEYAE